MKKRYLYYEMKAGEISNPYLLKDTDIDAVLSNDFGSVLPSDVGKLIYLRHGIIQMENEEQRQERGQHGK